jgi:hypothetical protein
MLLLPPLKDGGDPLKAVTFFQTVGGDGCDALPEAIG